jgi:TrmH family RNA methyltransferase
VVAAAKLHDRKERLATGATLLEGPHLIGEAVSAGAAIDTIFVLAGEPPPPGDGDVVVVTEEVLQRLAPTEHPRGPVAVFRPDPQPLSTEHCLVLWGLSDPGNAGTLIRTAAAFGLDLVVTPRSVDVWSPKVLRAGAGGHFRIGFGEVETITELEGMGYRSIAAVASGGAWPDEVQVRGRIALIIGNEAHGLPPEVAAAADVRVSIPMPGGTESFNAGVAGSILAYAMLGS